MITEPNIESFFDVSVVVPFYRKLSVFKTVLAWNSRFFQRNGIEVIIVADEPSEAPGLKTLLDAYPLINWKLVVNPTYHSWRNPAPAINVGIRAAVFEYVLVMSPESEFFTDAILVLRKWMDHYPKAYSTGAVCFGLIDENRAAIEIKSRSLRPYGSIMVRRKHLEQIGGYNENFSTYGGDDVELRARLELSGLWQRHCPGAILLHREDKESLNSRNIKMKHLTHPSMKEQRCIQYPVKSDVNGTQWGRSFNDFQIDWQKPCNRLGKTKAYLSGLVDFHIAQPDSFEKNHRIIALVQAYQESEQINSFLEHIEESTDGIILLVDRSDWQTYTKADNPKLILKCLKGGNRFDDLKNRNMLLDIASFLSSDWVFFIDVDERFDHRFQNLWQATDEAGDASIISFYHVNLWNDHQHYRSDYPLSARGIQVKNRMFRPCGRLQIISSHRLHFNQVPLRGKVFQSQIVLLHLACVDPATREAKARFYEIEDQDGSQPIGYSHFLDKDALTLDISDLPEEILRLDSARRKKTV